MSIFPLGLSQILEAEGEDAGVGEGWFKNPRCEGASSLRTQARTPSLAKDARRGEPSNQSALGLTQVARVEG